MATYSEWFAPLVARLPGAGLDLIKQELAASIREFCRDALPWQKLSDTYSVAASEESLEVNPVDNRSKVIFVRRVFWGDDELAPMAWKPAAANNEGHPLAFTTEGTPDVVTFIPTPNVGTDELRIVMALAPTDPSIYVPDFFVDNYFDVILDGALGRLYNLPFKPFSDEKKASYHLRRYRNKAIEARVISTKGNTRDGQQWNFPEFGT